MLGARLRGVILRTHLQTIPVYVSRKALLQKLQLNTIISRNHKNFGHETEETPKVTRYFYKFVGTLFILCILDWQKLIKMLKSSDDSPEVKLADSLNIGK